MRWFDWIITLFLISSVIFIMAKMKDDEEPYYVLKIILYYLLGAFRFSFNQIHMPLGFIIFFLFLRSPQNNQRGKRYAAGLGLIAFAVALIIPAIGESYYERTRYVELETTNVYEFNFQSHWQEVAEKLELNENAMSRARIEELDIDYTEKGELKRLSYEVTWTKEGKLHHARISFHEGKKKFSIRAVKIEEWLQYDRLISAKKLFEMLDQIEIEDLTPKGNFSYYSLRSGEWGSFGASNGKNFIVEENKIVPFTGELPVKCYWIVTFGMKQTGEYSYSSADEHYYLFNVHYE
ncbi:hypothetical protein R9X47_09905 [Wukongibacter baidiensis]|uniref:hypothetical protein n=1 Tax=Wukongibacter baidiensis TaxID=1723361 RepID=UPI003D7FC0F9